MWLLVILFIYFFWPASSLILSFAMHCKTITGECMMSKRVPDNVKYLVWQCHLIHLMLYLTWCLYFCIMMKTWDEKCLLPSFSLHTSYKHISFCADVQTWLKLKKLLLSLSLVTDCIFLTVVNIDWYFLQYSENMCIEINTWNVD